MRGVDVIVAPHGTQKSFTVRLPASLLAVLVILVVAFLVAGTLSLLTYAKILSRAMRADRLAAENDSLRVQVSRIAVLESEMADLVALKARVLELAGSQPGLLEPLVSRKVPMPMPAGGKSVPGDTVPLQARWDPSRPDFFWPVYGPISQGFKEGRKGRKPHPGIDIAASTGTPVLCVEDGSVTYAGQDSVLGNLVIVNHGNQVTSWYGHNSRLAVVSAQKVKKGAVIAFVGSTGISTAPHLHLEIRKNGVPVDPLTYLSESPMARKKAKKKKR